MGKSTSDAKGLLLDVGRVERLVLRELLDDDLREDPADVHDHARGITRAPAWTLAP